MALFGKFRQYTAAALWYPDFTMPHGRVATRSVVRGHVHKNSAENENPEALIYKASGSRSGGIRTRGLLVPNQTRYQTALHLDARADEGTRTPDLLITNRLLYQLSHIGTTSKRYYSKAESFCPALFLGEKDSGLNRAEIDGKSGNRVSDRGGPQEKREKVCAGSEAAWPGGLRTAQYSASGPV